MIRALGSVGLSQQWGNGSPVPVGASVFPGMRRLARRSASEAKEIKELFGDSVEK
jgi:hypothetical protein